MSLFGRQPANHESLQGVIQDLRKSVAWMDLVFAHLSESICVVDRSGAIKFANDAFAGLVNQVRILLLGRQMWDFLKLTDGADGKQFTVQTLESAWSSEHDRTIDGKYLLGDKIIELSGHYIPGIDQMIVVIRDVSEAERTRREMVQVMDSLQVQQQKLQEGAAKDEAMLNSIGDAVIAADKDGKMVFMNPSAESLFELKAADHVGQPVVDVVPFYDEYGEVIPGEKRPLSRALLSGKRESNDNSDRYYYHLKNSEPISVSVTITPVMLAGKAVGAIGIYRDITQAQEVDRMKTEFISLASHQLRTPLSAIRWFSEMLVTGDVGELNNEQREFAVNISQSTERMIELVGSLLNISRMESGRIIVEPEPTNLNDLIAGIVKDLQAKIGEREQQLAVSVHEGLTQVNIDRRLIGQVYMNLLTNAIKYTAKGGDITVMVSMKGEEIISQISDSGYGIPKEQQGKLFQKFFRAENAVKIETDGTGLGLYLAKAIIESSGGKIWFKSEEGKGTTFWFSLPASGMVAKKGEVRLDVPLSG